MAGVTLDAFTPLLTEDYPVLLPAVLLPAASLPQASGDLSFTPV